ncbi:alpha/beta hydrolase [Streptomyces sp. 549]|uniref:alpha/beta fold hydrolase n=1 Tax=Streptomyces sp. 549 TaxID=3049076 RepID=UPI0024C367F5|nr:alpha/beta hydrolase [Streptomyces sp. 549]MDK1476124.1 alpha/beta hydrolase [Streptomyces sp. 549]
MDARSVISRDGTRIGWTTTGRGEPLVLVHGAGADHTRWGAYASKLSDRFALHLVDRRGRGLSSDGQSYSIEREYDDIAAVAEAIGSGVTVLGHSYGGPIALGATMRTAAITRAVCYEGWPAVEGGPMPFGEGDAPDRVQALLDAGDEDGAVTLLMRELVGLTQEQVEWMRGQPMWAGRLAAAHTLPRELRTDASITLSEADLRSISTPVLLLIGGQNEESLRPQARELCSLLQHGRIGVLPGQGHMAMDTAPELLTDTITSFMESKA